MHLVVVVVGGGGGGNLGVILVRMCGPTFQNQPYSDTWALKIGTHSYMYLPFKITTYPYSRAGSGISEPSAVYEPYKYFILLMLFYVCFIAGISQ